MARRHPPTPLLEGIPSPGLRRIHRMNPRELRAHLRRLETEIEKITTRLKRLEHEGGDQSTRPACEARKRRAISQRQRLVRLVEEGRRIQAREKVQ